jgi:hypothetical protein
MVHVQSLSFEEMMLEIECIHYLANYTDNDRLDVHRDLCHDGPISLCSKSTFATAWKNIEVNAQNAGTEFVRTFRGGISYRPTVQPTNPDLHLSARRHFPQQLHPALHLSQ